ncbi:MAG: hypothetical protein JSW52_11975 [Candidatus Coatesbacteria bacterium]|nr:MAG: hypothetical protein JSW52_11975 [Candidatus Coatesbacteria bacterium]
MKELKILSGLTVVVILVTGCINYDQELIINEDGSGTVAVYYMSDDPTGEMGAPVLSFTEEEIETEYAGSGVRVTNINVVVPNEDEEGSSEATYYLDFADITDMNGYGIFAVKEVATFEDKIIQIFSLDETDGVTTFTQTCTLNMNVEDAEGLEDYAFTYSLTCPEAVTMTNGSVKLDGRTVSWRYTLPELIEGPVKMYAVYGGSGETGQGCVGPGRVSD